MKTKTYITALLIIMAMTAGAQDYYREYISPRPSSPQTNRNIQKEWGYWDIYPKKEINRSFLKDDYYDRTYYPYYVFVKSLAVRSAPSYDAPILTTISQGEVIHLTGGDYYPWKSMRVTYFDADAWAYRTTVGYVNSQLVRSPVPSSANNRANLTVPAYADPSFLQNTRSKSRPIIDRTYTDQSIIVRRNFESKGSVSIWTNCEDDGYIDVYIDGDYAGKLTTSFYSMAPVCGEEGTVVRELTAGKHDISAFGSTRMWNMEADVLPGRCTLKLLSGGNKERTDE
ncbi:MAG: SH3 domain-containing protein [Tannerella sp.]|jgi:hypothetical protein|nr:SH3 domain-containing protein [Tannerella sp.]